MLVNETVKKEFGKRKERILQFGEGNFLRAFADWMIDLANERGDLDAGIVLCQPIAQGLADLINSQDGVYTLCMRGIEEGCAREKFRKITSVSRCIDPYRDYDALMSVARSEDLQIVISNTTEAGISYHEGDKLTDRPPVSFPAKVTALLYERYKAFNGAKDKGLLFVPVELIDNNGANLRRIVLDYAKEWKLPEEFIGWIQEDNKFTSTLVDRIVTGYPRDTIGEYEEKLGYKDNLLVTSEIFNLWVIEGKQEWSEIFPIHKGEAHVIWTNDVTPYKKRKVRILNGGHTSTVLGAYLSGCDIVLDFMNNEKIRTWLATLLFEEVIPTLDLSREELEQFANDVLDRFANPYIKHRLLDISLNSCSKFAVRCLPSLLAYEEKFRKLPERLTLSFAAFIAFYRIKCKDGEYFGTRYVNKKAEEYPVKDNAEVLEFFEKAWNLCNTEDDASVYELVKKILAREDYWGKDLNSVKGLTNMVSKELSVIIKNEGKVF